jgi:hypothetical protein
MTFKQAYLYFFAWAAGLGLILPFIVLYLAASR